MKVKICLILLFIMVLFGLSAKDSKEVELSHIVFSFKGNTSYLDAEKILLGNVAVLDEGEITDISLAKLTSQELRKLRNLIYARYGKIFNSKDLTYFYKEYFSWYEEKYTTVDEYLTELDKINIQHIQRFESKNAQQSQKVTDIELDGVFWQLGKMVGSGYNSGYVFNKDGQFFYRPSSMNPLPVFDGCSGIYKIQGNVLTLYVKKVFFYDHTTEYEISYGILFWDNAKRNSFTFESPIEYSYPITEIKHDDEDKAKFVTIGNSDYYAKELDDHMKIK